MLDLLERSEEYLAAAAVQTDIGTCAVLGIPIAAATNQDVVEQVNRWIETSDRPRLITFANVHMVVEAHLRPRFRAVLNRMDLNCPDGAPVFWLARRGAGPFVEKFSGPDFMPAFCESSVALGYRHFIYGGAEGVAEQAAAVLRARYPGIRIVGHHTPPFRALTESEADAIVEEINEAAPDVIWVSLGCPRQEWWLNEFGPRLNAKVIFAVGQATDIIAGCRSRAPSMVSKLGLEWMYRLCREPGRLWKRYLVTNSLFLLLLLRDKLLPEVETGDGLAGDLEAREAGSS